MGHGTAPAPAPVLSVMAINPIALLMSPRTISCPIGYFNRALTPAQKGDVGWDESDPIVQQILVFDPVERIGDGARALPVALSARCGPVVALILLLLLDFLA